MSIVLTLYAVIESISYFGTLFETDFRHAAKSAFERRSFFIEERFYLFQKRPMYNNRACSIAKGLRSEKKLMKVIIPFDLLRMVIIIY